MRILFVHQNFPSQFGHIARHLVRSKSWQCDFVSETPAGIWDGVRKIQYQTSGGARTTTHYFSRTFENAVWHAHAVYQACEANPDLAPDLIVGHSGFGSTVFLPDFSPACRLSIILNTSTGRMVPTWTSGRTSPPSRAISSRARARNGMILLDLQTCCAGYSPTQFQRNLFPGEYRPKIEVIFDGIDTEVFCRRPDAPRWIAGRAIPTSTRFVTYVSRGFESMRGFDIFMRPPVSSPGNTPTSSSSSSGATGSAMAAMRSTSGMRRSASTSWRATTMICRNTSSRGSFRFPRSSTS